MAERLATVAFLVREYDEAIDWFIQKLGFEVVADAPLGDGKRWVLVAPGDQTGAQLLLAKVVGPEQHAAIGKAAGGRVAYFLFTDDFTATYSRMLAADVKFRELPRHEAYGTVAVFEDLYGNKWDLIQPVTPA